MFTRPPSNNIQQILAGINQSASLEYRRLDIVAAKANGGLAVQVTGTFAATLQVQATLDGNTWVPINMTNITSGIESSNITAAGLYTADLVGITQVRAITTAYSSGSLVVTLVTAEG